MFSNSQHKGTRMNDNVRLVRHPAAKPTESMFSYILRLAQENGYSSCSSLFSLIGMPYAMIGTAEITVARRAFLTNQSVQNLETISYKFVRCPTCRLLGNRFTLDFSRARTSDLMHRVPQVGVESKQVDRQRRSRKNHPTVPTRSEPSLRAWPRADLALGQALPS